MAIKTIRVSLVLSCLLSMVGCSKGVMLIENETALKGIQTIAVDHVSVRFRDTDTEMAMTVGDTVGRRSPDSIKYRLGVEADQYLEAMLRQNTDLMVLNCEDIKTYLRTPIAHDTLNWHPEWLKTSDSANFDAIAHLDLMLTTGSQGQNVYGTLLIYPKDGTQRIGVVKFDTMKGKSYFFSPTLDQSLPDAIEGVVKKFATLWAPARPK